MEMRSENRNWAEFAVRKQEPKKRPNGSFLWQEKSEDL